MKAGDKIGYLNPKTLKYKWVTIESIEGSVFNMLEQTKQSSYGRGITTFTNRYKETRERINKYLKECEEGTNLTLMKHKPL